MSIILHALTHTKMPFSLSHTCKRQFCIHFNNTWKNFIQTEGHIKRKRLPLHRDAICSMKTGIYINKYVKDGHVESETFDNSFDADHASKRGSQRFNLPYLKTMVFETVREQP